MKIESSFSPIDIAISGMNAHRKQMEIISSNVANIQTTDDGSGKPYRRLTVDLKSQGAGVSSVEVDDISKDMSDFHKMIARPGDPRADKDGYVTMPNVDLSTELMDLNIASRAYQANVAMLKRYQKMVQSSLELLK
jgi:flagellar basal-body rod protein FlgC